eukprot:snap_masked-scaffold_8-processed-gene-6.29-mRNA-1 protein AED:0.40 eAED:0.40 QI:0/-1/0/1/-1/1/1/0/157
MLKGIFIINNQGELRLSKFYVETDRNLRQRLISDIFEVICQRTKDDPNFCLMNFTSTENGLEQWTKTKTKLIYRHYATLYFIFAVEETESELGILDLIQVFVETLDKQFENVCELDLIFHLEKVHYILDEMIQAGLVLQTNMNEVILHLNQQNQIRN